jgi:ABC-type transport system substrate-binding protein
VKSKLILQLIALVSVALVLLVIPASANPGPKTDTLLIHIYYNPDVENADLPTVLDINDWPLSSDWISKYSKPGSGVTLREYTEMGMMEFDMNNQMWPTGWPGNFDALDPHMSAAVHFRKAIAYLTDKAKIVSDILKGLGIALETPLTPALKKYQSPDIPQYGYAYSEANALAELAAGGFTLEGGVWKWGGQALPALKIFSRLDDPNRRIAADYLVAELKAIGFGNQLDYKITERTVCYQYCMVLYDYNIYTGGWSLSADPDYLYDLYATAYYYGWGAPAVGWAPNYPGFCNPEYDSWAYKVKYATNEVDLKWASWNATKIFWQMEPIVALWSAAAVKAYKTGITHVVNMDGYGIDNYYSFMGMDNTGDNIIDYGFKSEPEALNVISSQWVWDWNVLGEVYESLLGRNPYNLAHTALEPYLAAEKAGEPTEYYVIETVMYGKHVKVGDPELGYVLKYDNHLKWDDKNDNGVWDDWEKVYWDTNNDGIVSMCDVRIPADVHVKSGDSDVGRSIKSDPHFKWHDKNGNSYWDKGEIVYWDTNNDGVVTICDVKLIPVTQIIFFIRPDVTWQDGVAFTADDVVFSWQFTKACGSGVAWNYALVRDMNSSWISGPNEVTIRYNKESMFFDLMAGGLPIIPKHIYEAQFPLWNTTSFVPSAVRAWRPWEEAYTGPNGIPMTKLVGTGPWIFVSWTHGETIRLDANRNYYFNAGQTGDWELDMWASMKESFFEYKGDASSMYTTPYDIGIVHGADIVLVTTGIVHNSTGTYDKWCDFYEEGKVGLDDLDLVTFNYGKVSG